MTSRTVRRLLVLDDFYFDPYSEREQALSLFGEYGDGSQRTRVSPTFPISGTLVNSLVEMAALREGQLIDGYMRFHLGRAGDPISFKPSEHQFNLVVMLNPDPPVEGGIRLVRSRRSHARSTDEIQTLEQMSATYDNTIWDETAWETVDQIGNVFNRAVLWDGRSFAAASRHFGHDRSTARLVQLVQFDVHAVEQQADGEIPT